MNIDRKLVSEFVEEVKRSGKKVVFINGCFDIFYIGYVIYLNEVKR